MPRKAQPDYLIIYVNTSLDQYQIRTKPTWTCVTTSLWFKLDISTRIDTTTEVYKKLGSVCVHTIQKFWDNI